MEGFNRPIPFLLDGPPGTGKTRTLVAAIAEMVQTTKNHILVCAQSNSACDEMTERLLKVLKNGELFRMYAKSFNPDSISRSIRPITNLQKGEIKFPSLKFIYKYRVVVCTLQTSGCLVRARGVDPAFNSNHFSHLIIDEAAFTHESATLIPIAGKYFDRIADLFSDILFLFGTTSFMKNISLELVIFRYSALGVILNFFSE